MANLFQFPKVSGLASSKLYFYQTGTTTPQNTYQEEALTTPHANPVVADSNGVFAPIYLDPALPSYRVKYTTSADVLVYQIDGYPSSSTGSQSFRLQSTLPEIFWYDTNGTSGQRKFTTRVEGNKWVLYAVDDAESIFTSMVEVRGGLTQRLVLNQQTTVDVSGTEYQVAWQSSGNFTGTLTGMAATTTVTVNWLKNGNIVHMYISSGTTGTSNDTTMTMTGLPAAVTPASNKSVPTTNLIDNSNNLAGVAQISSGGTITFNLYRTGTVANRVDYNSTIFTNSGSKGIFDGWSVTYAV